MTLEENKSQKSEIFAISISPKKGTPKTNQKSVRFVKGHGIEHDAHAGGDPIRQISLLEMEGIIEARKKMPELMPGAFGENITTIGVRLIDLNIGDRLKVGKDVLLEITKRGKECHTRCHIYQKLGDCIMPKEGIFAKIIEGGDVKPGDEMKVLKI